MTSRRVVLVHVPWFCVRVLVGDTWHEVEVFAHDQEQASTRAERELGFTSAQVSATWCSAPCRGKHVPIRGYEP